MSLSSRQREDAVRTSARALYTPVFGAELGHSLLLRRRRALADGFADGFADGCADGFADGFALPFAV